MSFDSTRAEWDPGPVQHVFVLLRHGQSGWNEQNRFTGWTDVALTHKGRQEARQAGLAMMAAGLSFDLAYTSVLQRAIQSLEIILNTMALAHILVKKAWELNERHYGALQGLNKAAMARYLGSRRVMYWRRSYAGRPPALTWDDHRHPRFDPRYAGLPPQDLPATESLADTARRLLPCWQQSIAPTIRSDRRVLVVAHGNSLRALVAYLEQVPEPDVPGINIPTGVPWVYTLDQDLQPIKRVELLI